MDPHTAFEAFKVYGAFDVLRILDCPDGSVCYEFMKDGSGVKTVVFRCDGEDMVYKYEQHVKVCHITYACLVTKSGEEFFGDLPKRGICCDRLVKELEHHSLTGEWKVDRPRKAKKKFAAPRMLCCGLATCFGMEMLE